MGYNFETWTSEMEYRAKSFKQLVKKETIFNHKVFLISKKMNLMLYSLKNHFKIVFSTFIPIGPPRVDDRQVRRILNLDHNTSLSQLLRALKCLGKELVIDIRNAA